jgi:hypothetical protein
MEGRTWVIQRLQQEIQKRQLKFTEEDKIEIDLEKRDFLIVV